MHLNCPKFVIKVLLKSKKGAKRESTMHLNCPKFVIKVLLKSKKGAKRESTMHLNCPKFVISNQARKRPSKEEGK
jgi:hypothetical protein